MKLNKRSIFVFILTGLQAANVWAQIPQAQTCNTNIPLTRPDSRYEVVDNATPAGSEVRDKVTGLIWQRCVQGMSWTGTCTGTASTHTWQQALYLAGNATASTAATGAAAVWRLPNHAELFSLAERACYNPAINTTWFPTTSAAILSNWSSSPSTSSAWSVEFYYGSSSTIKIDTAHRVRLVRSGQ